ncbi:OsmC family protein [Daejeonella oryzae]|uniref:OsmC family protein n=1 Tax=Daejeonella oryzae TaxID=1122943 RepID=UPI0004264887|nr:OsmC family protein [Daejeonella oryzae]
MAQHEIDSQWMGKMQFNSFINGHTIVMDAPEKVGGEDSGPIPKPFLLTALSGCTGMDIVSILRKAQKEVKDLSIKVTGELSKQQPIEYLSIHVTYDFLGEEMNKEAAMDAVSLSQEKYCGVSHLLKKALPVTWEVNYNEIAVFDNRISEVEV